ncbi:arsenate-mycothiol transferase ArsC [Arundinibacter roseus]|uniref:Protein-tyrosine-phosphatase n=1 Tax=Arundinibacter roseus TaxID=2070510 RepID=A0A4R4KLN2_9BACT|nr:protein-tyrosine-phosphatase [Arundinibacter roseus]TDB69188.1 protein-tyrosine-phosphatase [Arundinibacter roseus]
MLPALAMYFESLNPAKISPERLPALNALRGYIQEKIAAHEPINLTFICTHNSRRSHFGQVWAQVAAHAFGLSDVQCFSGGTENTACNPRTIAALERAGVRVVKTTEGENPVYALWYDDEMPPVEAFSKVYDQAPNPVSGFAAIMTCSHAEENCPFIPGAECRLPVMYEDPKAADDSPLETQTYDERCRQIATEMKYVFSDL